MSKNTIFTGAAVALATPMHQDGAINYEALGALIDFQIENGTDALRICGTTGEASTMTDEEQIDCVRYSVQRAAGRVPVIAGAGSNNTSHAIDLARGCAEAGADATLQGSPYYNKTSQAGLVRHFTAIADAVDLPIILYNIPGRTGVNIAPETCRILADHPGIVGVKEASGNLSQVATLAQLCGDVLDIYSGNDDQILPVLSLGGKGVISVLSNVLPRQTHDMCQFFFDGRFQESLALQLGLLPLIHALFSDVNPIPVKEALNLMGKNAGPCRMPLIKMQEGPKVRLAEVLREAGVSLA